MKIRKINKKGSSIGAGMAWIVATFIIIFIMIIFIALTALSQGKSLFGLKGNELRVDSEFNSNLILSENIFSYLNYKNSNGDNIKDLLFKSLDNYLNNEGIKKDITNINDLTNFLSDNEVQFILKEDNDKLFQTSQEFLDQGCSDYMLKIPQGVIKKGFENFVSEEGMNLQVEDFIADWTGWQKFKIPYEGHFIEIKYRQLRKC